MPADDLGNRVARMRAADIPDDDFLGLGHAGKFRELSRKGQGSALDPLGPKGPRPR